MNPERRFQSETGQSIDDNNCSLLFGNLSPLFYTVNPHSRVSLRQQEQLGSPAILKSFRDLPGCTRLSSSLTSLERRSKRPEFPLLPNINQNQRSSMGKSLPGHHATKRFVRERYNAPLRVNAKIRHVYTQEVTAVDDQAYHRSQEHSLCHRHTQTEQYCFPQSEPEAEAISKEEQVGEGLLHQTQGLSASTQPENGDTEEKEERGKWVDAATSPIPLQEQDSLSKDTSYPFSGCSQMTVYPPLNYVRKLEDLEKITGHIVIQRFFTKADDAFGTWLEKQLGMTSKSVSVDTSEFENPQTADLPRDNEIGESKEIHNGADDILKPGMSGAGEVEQTDDTMTLATHQTATIAECAFTDLITCECFLEELEQQAEYERLKELEEQIVPDMSADSASDITIIPDGGKIADEVETLISSTQLEQISDNPVLSTIKKEHVDNIDEVVRCTLEAYLLAPSIGGEVECEEEQPQENSQLSTFGIAAEVVPTSPKSQTKSEIDSGRADSIESHEKTRMDGGPEEVEGNTSHDSAETVFEIPVPSTSSKEVDEEGTAELVCVVPRSLSADSCIGTESSGDTAKNINNESQSSNEIEGLESMTNPTTATSTTLLDSSRNELKELVDLHLGATAGEPASAKTEGLGRRQSAKARISSFPLLSEGVRRPESQESCPSCAGAGTSEKTESEDAEIADASESESEISDNLMVRQLRNASQLLIQATNDDDSKLGTDLELEEYADDGDDEDERDAFDTMVANHLKYSRGVGSTGGSVPAGGTTTSRVRGRLNRGTQTTHSIEPSPCTSSLSPCSSSNSSSFDVEIISKSKRITTMSSLERADQNEMSEGIITPRHTVALHESSRRRSYLPTSSSSLNLLNMKFSLGKDFESEVSIRMPSKCPTNSAALLSSSSRAQQQPHHPPPSKRDISSSSYYSHNNAQQQHQSASGTRETQIAKPTELQSLWNDVKTKLDVQVDEIATSVEQPDEGVGLQIRGSGILPSEAVTLESPVNRSSIFKLKKNEEKIKRSLQRLKKILDD